MATTHTPSTPPSGAPQPARRLDLAVDGMSCEACVRHVTQALAALPSVASVVVDLAAGRATLEHDPERAPLAALLAALEAEGYAARQLAP
jgi:copper chaperone CopZ